MMRAFPQHFRFSKTVFQLSKDQRPSIRRVFLCGSTTRWHSSFHPQQQSNATQLSQFLTATSTMTTLFFGCSMISSKLWQFQTKNHRSVEVQRSADWHTKCGIWAQSDMYYIHDPSIIMTTHGCWSNAHIYRSHRKYSHFTDHVDIYIYMFIINCSSHLHISSISLPHHFHIVDPMRSTTFNCSCKLKRCWNVQATFHWVVGPMDTISHVEKDALVGIRTVW